LVNKHRIKKQSIEVPYVHCCRCQQRPGPTAACLWSGDCGAARTVRDEALASEPLHGDRPRTLTACATRICPQASVKRLPNRKMRGPHAGLHDRGRRAAHRPPQAPGGRGAVAGTQIGGGQGRGARRSSQSEKNGAQAAAVEELTIANSRLGMRLTGQG